MIEKLSPAPDQIRESSSVHRTPFLAGDLIADVTGVGAIGLIQCCYPISVLGRAQALKYGSCSAPILMKLIIPSAIKATIVSNEWERSQHEDAADRDGNFFHC